MKIIVATHNEGKLAEIRRILEERLGADAADIELVSAGSLGLPDPVEDGVTFQENALIKARDVAERTGCPAVADDSGLIVDVMGNAPFEISVMCKLDDFIRSDGCVFQVRLIFFDIFLA